MRALLLSISCGLACCWLAAGAADPSAKIAPPEDRGYLRYPLRIMNRSTYEAYHFAPDKGELATLSYSVSKTGWVRVRLIRRDDHAVVLRTLSDWTEANYGRRYRVQWHGTDASGNPVDRRRMFVSFESRDSVSGGIHQRHPTAHCRDPQLTIANSGNQIVAQLDGSLPLPDAYRGRLYVDFELVEEVVFDRAAGTFAFDFRPGAFAPGEHLLTINIDDYQDHVATASLGFRSDPPGLGQAAPHPPGEQAPPLSIPDLSGRQWNLSEQRGQVLLLNFWATWCPPCRHEMPALEAMYRSLRDRGFVVVGIASDALGAPAVGPVAERLGLTFPILLDPDSIVTNRYRVRVRPTSFLVDRDGMLVARMVGPQPWNRDELIAPIKNLLASSPPPGRIDPQELSQ